MDKDLNMARKIAEKVREQGGKTYFVGGYVRDKLLWKDNKDIDIEVHNIEPDILKGILESLGNVQTQGASFGVYNLKGYDIDIAQPRKEENTGRGHKDFEVYVNPFIGEREAARRRDFTINAIMENVLTGKIVDPFNGRHDLENQLIRHIDDKTFTDDPLRVFRAAQFAARFDFTLAMKTFNLMRTIDTSDLSRERVWGEMEKAFLKSTHPSIFFEVLRETYQLDQWFPEVQNLIDCPQNQKYHPEGDVWTHTMYVIDEAAKYRYVVSNPVFFMTAALCHDFGKPISVSTDKDGIVHNIDHEIFGIPAVKDFLERLNHDNALKYYVEDMVKNHGKPHCAFENQSRVKSTNHMFDEITNKKDICYLALADTSGKGEGVSKKASEEFAFLAKRYALYEARAKEPMVTGKDLIDMNLKPSPEFTDILAHARKCHFSGVDKEAVLKDIKSKYGKNMVKHEIEEEVER